MKIVVASDCHGDLYTLRKIASSEYDADYYLLLGDSCLDEESIRPFISVKGNNDYFSSFPLERIIHTPYGNIYMEHGHLRNIVDVEFVRKKDCFIYLFGHSHAHFLKKIEGIYFANPGSTSRPRDNTNGTYLLISLDEKDVKFDFVYL